MSSQDIVLGDGFGTPAIAASIDSFSARAARPHAGMPDLDLAVPRYPSFKRRFSDPVFYMVPALMWLALSARHGSLTLPTAANTAMEVGGLWGESKAQGLSLFGAEARRWLAPYVTLVRSGPGREAENLSAALDAMKDAGLSFPIMAKPDKGYQGWGVCKICSEERLAAYLSAFPEGHAVILQQFVSYEGEAGIFYVRRPGEARGRIASMALTYAPHIVGDGVSNIGRLILSDPVLSKSHALYFQRHAHQLQRVPECDEVIILANCRSARVGAVYRDARHLVSDALEARIDEICRDIDGFCFGRFDLRFAAMDRLQQGQDFLILEINGAGAEMLHIWDGGYRLRNAYRDLWQQYRALFEIGRLNRLAGHQPAGIADMVRRRQLQERLRKAYPPSA